MLVARPSHHLSWQKTRIFFTSFGNVCLIRANHCRASCASNESTAPCYGQPGRLGRAGWRCSTALRLVLSDVTERKKAEERLQLAASVFSQTGEASSSPKCRAIFWT